MSDPIEASFAEVVSLGEQARKRAYEAIGHELVGVLRLVKSRSVCRLISTSTEAG